MLWDCPSHLSIGCSKNAVAYEKYRSNIAEHARDVQESTSVQLSLKTSSLNPARRL